MAAFAGTAYMSYDNLGKFNDAQGEYDTAKEIYYNSSDQPIIDDAFSRMQNAQSDLTDFDQQHNSLLFLAGGIWALNIVDVMIWGGGKAETFAAGDSPIKLVATPNRVSVAIKF